MISRLQCACVLVVYLVADDEYATHRADLSHIGSRQSAGADPGFEKGGVQCSSEM